MTGKIKQKKKNGYFNKNTYETLSHPEDTGAPQV